MLKPVGAKVRGAAATLGEGIGDHWEISNLADDSMRLTMACVTAAECIGR